MKLICVSGALQGREFEVPPGGLRIGRSADNDIVIEGDAQVSRHHARVEFAQGAWFVVDADSYNGVYLNERRIAERAPIALRDELRIGHLVLRAGASTPAEAGEAAAATPAPVVTIQSQLPPDAASAPPGVAEAGAPVAAAAAVGAEARPSGQRRKRLRLVLVALLALLVVGVLALAVLRPAGPTGALLQGAAPGTGDLRVYYEKLEATPAVLFRYELSLADGKLRVLVDDVTNDRRVEEERTLSPQQVEILRASLLTDAFLALPPVPAERRQTGLAREQLLLAAGRQGNCVRIENAVPPAVFAETAARLLAFVQGEVGIFPDPMPREEAFRLAEEEYLNARRLLAERTVDPANLYLAVRGYRQVLERLRRYDDKPEWFAQAAREGEESQKLLDEELGRLSRNAMMLKTAASLEEARRLLETIVGMVPDRDHPEARKARDEIIKINRLLEEKLKTR